MAIFQILGSLYFAVSLIAGLALTLIVSTLLESFYGTPFVQRHFYQSVWFNIFLGLLAVNILVSAMNRFPYKKRHTGFVMTHVGILMLLVGSLMSSLMGIDGQMMLFEGEKKNSVVLSAYELVVHDAGKSNAFTLSSGNSKVKHRLDSSAGPLELLIRRVWDNAVIKSDIIDSPSSPINHAAELSLSSQKSGVNEDLWLVENNPLVPGSNQFSMGPAVFRIGEKPKEAPKAQTADEAVQKAKLRLFKKNTDFDYSIDLENIPAGDIPLGKSGLKISDLKYYPDARVGDHNELVSTSDEPNNPAIEFNLLGAEGSPQHYVKFALFPEFESMHGKDAKKDAALSIELLTPPSSNLSKSHGPSLSIYYGPDGSWSYASKSSSSVSEGALKPGETYQTGWMDFSFRVKSLMDHANVLKKVERAPNGGKGQIAADVSIVHDGKTLFEGWVLEDGAQGFHINGQHTDLMLQAKNHKVPFSLELKDFRKVDYPGTSQPSSYESDVTLVDPDQNLTVSKTISMNKPLDHKGYRIFQSSYVQDASGEASVFTVAKNPGINLIYIGCIVMFIGSFLVFFVAPFSSMLKEDKK